ncbi:hypothetical protein NDU88_006867 [Pleurodeles waltl]|uniref:Uncharacterized protein n=1 Tax=Pleurodeles waltl TaxID=8319 RepID=A0AAV7SR53_PLEWA|nr:hypothetical protein NDU88_006867 [Pleurodeles waltl]
MQRRTDLPVKLKQNPRERLLPDSRIHPGITTEEETDRRNEITKLEHVQQGRTRGRLGIVALVHFRPRRKEYFLCPDSARAARGLTLPVTSLDLTFLPPFCHTMPAGFAVGNT